MKDRIEEYNLNSISFALIKLFVYILLEYDWLRTIYDQNKIARE